MPEMFRGKVGKKLEVEYKLSYHYNQHKIDFFRFLEEKERHSGLTHNHRKNGEWTEFPYISYSREEFARKMGRFLRKARTFIDIGCGGGDKLQLVKQEWPQVEVHGVEHNPATAAWAALAGDHIVCGDAFDIDYGRFDVIYAYWPISNLDLMSKLCMHVARTKKKKAVFILVGCGYITDSRPNGNGAKPKYPACRLPWKGADEKSHGYNYWMR